MNNIKISDASGILATLSVKKEKALNLEISLRLYGNFLSTF